MRKVQRLAAARAERDRRRQDQVARHAVRLVPRLDGLLLVAESAWRATVETVHHRSSHSHPAIFVPRHRRWHLPEREGPGDPGAAPASLPKSAGSP